MDHYPQPRQPQSQHSDRGVATPGQSVHNHAEVINQAASQNVQGNLNNNVFYYLERDPLQSLLELEAKAATFDSKERGNIKRCHKQTRVAMLDHIEMWINTGRQGPCLFCVQGFAGSGKSTIAKTVAYGHLEKGSIVATFSFSRIIEDISTAEKFVTTLAVQLARSSDSIKEEIVAAIRANSKISNKDLRTQWETLIKQPLSKLSSSTSILIVIDALDECKDRKKNEYSDTETIVEMLLGMHMLNDKVNIKILLTGRPEGVIKRISRVPDARYEVLALHREGKANTDNDIYIYLSHELETLRKKIWGDARPSWPLKSELKNLVCAAKGLFLWADVVVKYIQTGEQDAGERLSKVLGLPETTPVHERLDQIYSLVLKNSIDEKSRNPDEVNRFWRILKEILGALVLLQTPLSVASLAKLLGYEEYGINGYLTDLHAIIDLEGDGPIRLHHTCFVDFLLSSTRCPFPRLLVEEEQQHEILAKHCIKMLSECLKNDICGLGSPGVCLSDLDTDNLRAGFPVEIKYACQFWILHISSANTGIVDGDPFHTFLGSKLLQWVEAMILLGKISYITGMLTLLGSSVVPEEALRLSQFIEYAKKFIQQHQDVIQHYPLQVYCSALLFTPVEDQFLTLFDDQVPQWIKPQPQPSAFRTQRQLATEAKGQSGIQSRSSITKVGLYTIGLGALAVSTLGVGPALAIGTWGLGLAWKKMVDSGPESITISKEGEEIIKHIYNRFKPSERVLFFVEIGKPEPPYWSDQQIDFSLSYDQASRFILRGKDKIVYIPDDYDVVQRIDVDEALFKKMSTEREVIVFDHQKMNWEL